jgi:hypothetical protein
MLSDDGLDLIFRTARTHRAWLDRPVPDALLRQVYELSPGNADKIMQAPDGRI